MLHAACCDTAVKGVALTLVMPQPCFANHHPQQWLQVLAYHEAVREELRRTALERFLAPIGASSEGSEDGVELEARRVLVCTDRTSRGIDSMFCNHVVLFDFPRDPSEYVRRVGRTARGAGGRGVVSVLVLGKQVPLARDIIERNQRGAPVHKVPELT